ncbi:hypothetical protein BOX15_Mlig032636g1 [Macrostomum lignano]|uniref:CX domain-containing protein n=1 Tax=Macrostomum lignano TaxID=282301 RepID=A0A267EGT2_9PLAT|nr:hypothetical protein BOX15_Mlig032636g1 [Macrostomum lignano]
MKAAVFCIAAVFLTIIFSYPADARRGGFGGRFGGFLGSYRYSLSYRHYRYRSLRYRPSSSSRTYRRYYRRYSMRSGVYPSSVYRQSSRVKVSATKMGGITSNKKALLLAGSVYIATRVRPRIFNSRGNLFNKVTEDFAICAGLVRTRSNSTHGWYAYDQPELNDSSTSSALTPTEMSTTPGSSTAQRLTESGNSTGSSTTSPIVTYQYFLCPSDLFNYAYDGEDIYCCGPAGHQMCCSKEDFKEQLGKFSSVGLGMGLLFGVLFVASGCGITIYLCRDRVRSVFRKMGGSGSAGTARQDVTFRPVAKTETEKDAHVTLSDLRGRRRSNSRSQNNNLYPHSAPNPVPYPLYPTAIGGRTQPQYPHYPPQVNGSSNGGVSSRGNQLQYPLYPPQVNGSSNGGVSSRGNQPQYPLYPPPTQQIPPMPQHPPPAYESVENVTRPRRMTKKSLQTTL